jgi:hypothetical protein
MGRINYYLVNYTRLEFCLFNDRLPIFEELQRILDKYPKWQSKDAMMIKGEDESNAPDMWENLTVNLQYKDLDYDEQIGS